MHCIKSIFNHISQSQTKIIRRIALVNPVIIVRRYGFTQEEDDSDKIINDICKGDPVLEKKLRILMLEVEVMRQDGRCAPSFMKSYQWKNLMDFTSRNQRMDYLLFLFKTEKSRTNLKARKLAKKMDFLDYGPKEKEFPDDIDYGLSEQSLFLRIRDKSMNNFDNFKALQAMMYSQPIVLDCSYEEHMVLRELANAVKQACYIFGDNRIHKDPFNVHLCNVNLEGQFMDLLRRKIPNIEDPWFPLSIHSKSYLDLFPREKLVYLTPHCKSELTSYDHDAVYIIGCMVDKLNNEPLSLAKAKRDGIKMAKLPLDRYLEWAPGAKKNLNINHIVPILLDLRVTGSWESALKHVPRRKLLETNLKAVQRSVTNPYLRRELMKNFNKVSFRNKRLKSQRSLYDDDNF